MTEHSPILPAADEITMGDDGQNGIAQNPAQSMLKRALKSGLFWLVCVPTALVAIYLVFVATPQYRSQAQFVVRGSEAPKPAVSGFGQLLGGSSALNNSQRETYSLISYLRSAETLPALRKAGADPVAIFTRPEADIISKLWPADAPMEDVLKHYRGKVHIDLDPDTGITSLSVTTFRPADSRKMAEQILRLGEQRVNELNNRLIDSNVELAQKELIEAQSELGDVQSKLAGFRNRTGDINPASTGTGGQKQVFEQQAELDQQRALLADMRRYLSPSSPQIQAMRSRIASLKVAAARARSRLTGSPKSVAQNLGNYEELKLQQELAAKRYELARLGFKEAAERAEKDRLFVVQVVKPTTPEKAVLPKQTRTILTVFLSLLLAYALISLIIAGIREHRA